MSVSARETSGVTTRLIVSVVRDLAGASAVDELVRRAGDHLTLAQLEDEREWVSFDDKIRLFEVAAEVCGEPRLAHRVGASALDARIGVGLRAVIRALGSPQRVYREVVRIGPKFSTVSDLRCTGTGRTSAEVTYRLRPGHQPNRHDCDYNVGLLSTVPCLFGLPAARVEHLSCQVDGDVECRYLITWRERQRPWPRRGHRRSGAGPVGTVDEVRDLRRQIDDLQAATAELTAPGSLDVALERVVRRASSAVQARGFVVVVRPRWDERPTVHAVGVDPLEAEQVATEALAGARRHEWMVSPVATSTRSYGVVVAVQAPGHGFLAGEQAKLDAYASLASAAVEVAVERETAGTLLAVARDLAASQTVQSVADRGLAAVVELTGATAAAVVITGAAPDEPWVVATTGVTDAVDALLRSPRPPPSDAGSDIGFYHRHDTDRPQLVAAVFESSDVTAVARVRIRDGEGTTIGWVATAWTAGAPTEIDHDLATRLTGVAALLTPAIATARALESSSHLALHDPLTGLANRVLLADRYEGAVARARRHGGLIGLVLVDLDGFKATNDRHGHAAGDTALVTVADRLRQVIREADTAARLGGDEFVVITDAVSDTEVSSLARRIEIEIARPVTISSGAALAVAASAGAVTVAPDVTLADALARADASMFDRKRERRAGRETNDAEPSGAGGVPPSDPPMR